MSHVSSRRTSTQHLNGNMKVGKPPRKYADSREVKVIKEAAADLSEAINSTNKAAFAVAVGNAQIKLRRILEYTYHRQV